MKNQLIVLLLLFAFAFNSCKTKEKETTPITNEETTAINEFSLTVDYPVISSSSNPSEIKKSVESVTKIIDQAEEKFTKEALTLTLNNTANTPATIWYNNTTPIKITHGVANDAGAINGEFSYYLKEGKLWYSDQLFAKYLFEGEKLKYWMDAQWNVNNVSQENFTNREKQLLETVNSILKETNQ